jgi:plastocyanin
MRQRKLIVFALVVGIGSTVVGGAFAGRTATAATTTIRAISTGIQGSPNRYVQDGLRWDKDVYTVASGGTIRVVNLYAEEGPHTFTVVREADLPRTGRQMFNCRICKILGKAHGANPNSDAPPKFPFLENGKGQATPPSVDRPGDSGVTGKGKKGESITMTVTAPSGTTLHFMCIIHPWMQSVVVVT